MRHVSKSTVNTPAKRSSLKRVFSLVVVIILIGIITVVATTNGDEYNSIMYDSYEDSSFSYDINYDYNHPPGYTEEANTYYIGEHYPDIYEYNYPDDNLYQNNIESNDQHVHNYYTQQENIDEYNYSTYFSGFESDTEYYGIGIQPFAWNGAFYQYYFITCWDTGMLNTNIHLRDSWTSYTPPQAPTQHAAARFTGYVAPRYGFSLAAWTGLNLSSVGLGTLTSLNRQNPPGNQFYRSEVQISPNGGDPIMIPSFARLEVPAVNTLDHTEIIELHNFGTRLFGYDSIPVESITLMYNTFVPIFGVPSVPYCPTQTSYYPDFPPMPGPTIVPGANFNAVFQSHSTATSQSLPSATARFNFGAPGNISLQPVTIVHTPMFPPGQPRSTTTRNVGVEDGLLVGTHKDVVLIRHGPATVGELDLQFRVARPVTNVVIENPRDATTRNADISFVEPISINPPAGNTLLYSTASDPGATMSFDYTNPADPRPSRERDITVTLSLDCVYSYFASDNALDPLDDGNAVLFDTNTQLPDGQLPITPPPGYSIVSATVVNGDLVVVLRPTPWTFEFFKTCMAIYDPFNPLTDRNPLPGAVFELHWDLGSGFVLAYTTQPTGA
ncbi:MAG: hypothetical protein FWC92_01460, partial [Defluviitaleaceae bacterium]|nr:hypothetical protein [Defluviitaleaceae bacterium]